MDKVHCTSSYKVVSHKEGNIYSFFCDLSGELLYTSEPILMDDRCEELKAAWKDAKKCFNRCHKCGRWVSNAMFNPDELMCVDCAPWKEYPKYCSYCGKKINDSANFCPNCGKKIE